MIVKIVAKIDLKINWFVLRYRKRAKSTAVWRLIMQRTHVQHWPKEATSSKNGLITYDNLHIIVSVACEASVSSRGSSRKLGQEQKKNECLQPFFCFRSTFRAITRLETLATQAIGSGNFLIQVTQHSPPKRTEYSQFRLEGTKWIEQVFQRILLYSATEFARFGICNGKLKVVGIKDEKSQTKRF